MKTRPISTVNDPATTLAALVTQAIADYRRADDRFVGSGHERDAVDLVLMDRVTATVDALSFHPATTADTAFAQAAALVGLINLFSADAVAGGAPQQQLDTAARLAAGLLMFIQSACGAKNEDPLLSYFCGATYTARMFPMAYLPKAA